MRYIALIIVLVVTIFLVVKQTERTALDPEQAGATLYSNEIEQAKALEQALQQDVDRRLQEIDKRLGADRGE